MKKSILIALLPLMAGGAIAQNPVKVNQVGYYCDAEKIAVIEPEVKGNTFTLKDAKGKKVWSGKSIKSLK